MRRKYVIISGRIIVILIDCDKRFDLLFVSSDACACDIYAINSKYQINCDWKTSNGNMRKRKLKTQYSAALPQNNVGIVLVDGDARWKHFDAHDGAVSFDTIVNYRNWIDTFEVAFEARIFSERILELTIIFDFTCFIVYIFDDLFIINFQLENSNWEICDLDECDQEKNISSALIFNVLYFTFNMYLNVLLNCDSNYFEKSVKLATNRDWEKCHGGTKHTIAEKPVSIQVSRKICVVLVNAGTYIIKEYFANTWSKLNEMQTFDSLNQDNNNGD